MPSVLVLHGWINSCAMVFRFPCTGRCGDQDMMRRRRKVI
jgi:hypothetical protein